MFGAGYPCSLPFCSQPIMCPYDVPVCQPYPCPFPVPQPCVQNFVQPVDVPIQNTIQPVIVPTPVGVPVPQPICVPVERPCAVPVPQPVPVPVECPCPVPVPVDRPCPCPVPVPVDRPCAVPVPVCVPVPQPCMVPQPVMVREQVCVPVPMPVPMPVQAPPQCVYSVPCAPQYCYEEEYVEEPIYIKRPRRRRHHHRRHHRPCTPAPLPPIVIPVPIQAPTPVAEPTPYQVTEYVQDIYPPAQVFTDQVPVGYYTSDQIVQQSPQIQNQQSFNCQPGVILPPAPFVQTQPHLVQQLPGGQFIGRPLSVGGGGVQTLVSAQSPLLSPSNSVGLISPCLSGTQLIS